MVLFVNIQMLILMDCEGICCQPSNIFLQLCTSNKQINCASSELSIFLNDKITINFKGWIFRFDEG